MAWTLVEAQNFLTIAEKSYKAALQMQRYEIKDRSAYRAKLETLKDEMNYWKKVVDQLIGNGTATIKVKRYVPIE